MYFTRRSEYGAMLYSRPDLGCMHDVGGGEMGMVPPGMGIAYFS